MRIGIRGRIRGRIGIKERIGIENDEYAEAGE